MSEPTGNAAVDAEIAAGDNRTKIIRNLSQLSAAEANAVIEFLAAAEGEDLKPARTAINIWGKIPAAMRAEMILSLRRVFGGTG